ncbi:unnamed protein product [Meganyctiphanes norvegica]|uniref:AD domain-containing protein n=1 Tax=Meganyctiphanes norvegica TaxID=48144 RepID=A0AAV2QFD6_MEGNR
MSENMHTVFTNDPVKLHSMIHKNVSITTKDSNTHIGWVYTVDPVSESFILVSFGKGNTEALVTLVPGYNVTDISILDSTISTDTADAIDSLFRKKQVDYSEAELSTRREALSVWLSGNRVPFTVRPDMSIEVLQAAVIHPPYVTESIDCLNEVVLDKVIKLLQQMPGSTSNS